MAPLITLTTDFGWTDGFAGVLQGVILSICPAARVVDLSHGIPPRQLLSGAMVLAAGVPYFPPDSIHVCVVDPGVGSERRAIAIAAGETLFVGPDNGVLSLAVADIKRRRGGTARAYQLENPRYRLPRVSNTFHGRDIFAPAAAHLACGVALEELGAPLAEWITLARRVPSFGEDGTLVGRAVYIDRFGNVITDIADDTLPSAGTYELRIEIGGETLRGLSSAYADVARGELLALIGSLWKLEIAVRDGNAAEQLGIRVGDPVIVKRIQKIG